MKCPSKTLIAWSANGERKLFSHSFNEVANIECSTSEGNIIFDYSTPICGFVSHESNQIFIPGSQTSTLFFRSDGSAWDLYRQDGGLESLVWDNFSVLCGMPSLSNVRFLSGNSTLKVFDGSRLITSSSADNCNYQQYCEEECPDGFIKISRMNFPGHCCLSCTGVKSELVQIKNQLKKI